MQHTMSPVAGAAALPALALAVTLALLPAASARAQASFDPATQVLSVPTVTLGSQVWRDLRARLDADGRLTVLAITPPTVDLATRIQAATATAQGSANACAAIRPFYWEIGDAGQRLAGGSVAAPGGGTVIAADTVMNIASATKWLYGAYVAERRGGALTAEDVQALNFRSGYTSFGFSGCEPADSVASCAARGDNGVLTPAHVDHFYYNGGHMQKHASLPAPGMALGALGNLALATEMRRVLGTDIELSFSQPQLAGGARTNARSYASFLRKLLGRQLQMGALLGSHPVCTNPLTCPTALYSPSPPALSQHYSLGHWVEDDPATGDGAFSSPGAFGFYPWVDATRTLYGVVARVDLLGQGMGHASQLCGALVRKAWVSGNAL